MVAKAELEARAAQCDSVEDYVLLAGEALAEPADSEYARELLQEAESKSQFPVEFVKVAEVLGGPLEDRDSAAELYSQAEDMCFDGSEFLTVGVSLASTLGDKDKSRELINKGIGELKDPAEIIKLASVAEKVLGDDELATSLFARVEENCKSLEDYRDLAEKVKKTGDAETAGTVYAKAERYLSDVSSRVEYAAGAKEILGDTELAAKILAELESDCQFPAEFVALAQGFKTILDDDSQIDSLLQQGADFAMTGEEHLDLAKGYFELKGDREAAGSSYRSALADINDREKLLEMARSIATDLDDRDFAKEVYAKAEGKITSPGDLVKLGLSILDDLDDKEYVGEIFGRAEQKMANALDLIGLAGQYINRLEDGDRAAAVYRKGLEKTDEYAGLSSLLDAVTGKLSDSPLVGEILAKMEHKAESTVELLKLNDKVAQLMDDKEFSRRLLGAGEDRVSSLNELKAVVEAVSRDFGDDDVWNQRLAQKLQKREANQALYTEFQGREKSCKTPKQTMALASEIMDKLDDAFFARKLLAGVDEAFSSGTTLDFSLYRKLIEVVDSGIGDGDWAAQLLDKAAGKFSDFSGVKQLVDTASSLTNPENGRKLATGYLESYASALPEDVGTSDLLRLGRLRLDALGDAESVVTLVRKATESTANHLDLVSLGKLAADAGDDVLASECYEKAVVACSGAGQLMQISRRLRSYGATDDTLRNLYQKGEKAGFEGLDKLHWAEGIIDLFNDRDWARRAYDAIKDNLNNDTTRATYNASRKHRLERRL